VLDGITDAELVLDGITDAELAPVAFAVAELVAAAVVDGLVSSSLWYCVVHRSSE
jgi:hypothetical protein